MARMGQIAGMLLAALWFLPAPAMAGDLLDYGYYERYGDGEKGYSYRGSYPYPRDGSGDLADSSPYDYAPRDLRGMRRQMKREYRRFGAADFRREFSNPRDRARDRRRRQALPDLGRGMWQNGCLAPRQIHRRLRRQGWWDFERLRVRPFVLKVRARRPNGLMYKLKVDRCTGVIVSAKLVWRQYWMSRLFRYGYPWF